jgi:hypothetical protein
MHAVVVSACFSTVVSYVCKNVHEIDQSPNWKKNFFFFVIGGEMKGIELLAIYFRRDRL